MRKAEKVPEKAEIEALGLKAIESYFSIKVENLSDKALKHLHSKAKIGLQFHKESNLMKRAVEMNYIRVFRLSSENKKEFRALIKKTMPQYFK